mmetsp:Transcript_38712/g.124113  ORF Transcript_38712/g.124113 Transcript_38712/m.124113 type:complete len:296 (-) Transcript_38712:78-965(-)
MVDVEGRVRREAFRGIAEVARPLDALEAAVDDVASSSSFFDRVARSLLLLGGGGDHVEEGRGEGRGYGRVGVHHEDEVRRSRVEQQIPRAVDIPADVAGDRRDREGHVRVPRNQRLDGPLPRRRAVVDDHEIYLGQHVPGPPLPVPQVDLEDLGVSTVEVPHGHDLRRRRRVGRRLWGGRRRRKGRELRRRDAAGVLPVRRQGLGLLRRHDDDPGPAATQRREPRHGQLAERGPIRAAAGRRAGRKLLHHAPHVTAALNDLAAAKPGHPPPRRPQEDDHEQAQPPHLPGLVHLPT